VLTVILVNVKTILFIYNRISGVIKTILFIYNRISGVIKTILFIYNRIGGIIVSVLALSEVDRGFEPRSGQTKDYKIGICCFFTKHAALSRKNKDLLARDKDNVPERGDMSIHGLLFQGTSTIKIQLSVLV
jgi:hypothetical protein